MESQRQRRHGFAGPPNCYQVFSWIFSLVFCGFFYSLVSKDCPHELSLCALPAFSSSLFTALISYLKCALTDPSDAGVLYRLSSISAPVALTQFCLKCNAKVNSASKHCRACNRCTEDFDHHCVWINNCIGGKNYRWFVTLIISLEGMMLIETGTTGFLLFEVFNDGIESSDMVKKHAIGEHGVCFLVAVFCVALMCLFFSITVGYLIAFHAMLKVRRLSTFEYLVKTKMKAAKVHTVKYSAPELRDSAIIEAQELSGSLQVLGNSKEHIGTSFTRHPKNAEMVSFGSA